MHVAVLDDISGNAEYDSNAYIDHCPCSNIYLDSDSYGGDYCCRYAHDTNPQPHTNAYVNIGSTRAHANRFANCNANLYSITTPSCVIHCGECAFRTRY